MHECFGVLNINKPAKMTSHDVVSILRRLTKIKQIGHTGTLDPFAQGVLAVCIGRATRLIEFMPDDKEYVATIQFGKSTDTFDVEGQAIFLSDKKIAAEDITKSLVNFEGEILQTPPIYSALKVSGKKLYEYARAGETVKIEPRKVFIKKIELKSFDKILQQAEIFVACSKGTYIRSIANDLGKLLGCGGHLIKLVRTKVGELRLDEAVELDRLTAENVFESLINPLEILPLRQLELTDEDYRKVKNGNAIKNKKFNCGETVILIYNKVVAAVAEAQADVIKIKKVLNNEII